MAKLTTKERSKMPASEFAEPKKKAYPINDKSHARNALARVSQHGTPKEKKEIRAKVAKKFPAIKEGDSKRSGRKKEMGHEPHKAITSQTGTSGHDRRGKNWK